MNIEVTWTELKRITDSKQLPLQWVDADDRYHIALVDGPFVLFTTIDKADASAAVFEATYKAAGNKRTENSTASFTSKLVGTKKLYARTAGSQHALAAGSNVFTITASFPWVKVTGVEVFGAETLDFVDFKVKDTAAGTYSGVPNYVLNQFGFSVNLAKDYYRREASFDADLYQGMVLEFTYNSVSAKTIAVNLIQAESEMRQVYLEFTSPKRWFAPFSWAIRAVELTKYSHVRIKFRSGWFSWTILEASGTEVKIIGIDGSKHHPATVHHRYELLLNDDQFKGLIGLLRFAGVKYGVKQAIGIGIQRMFHMKRNPFADGERSMVCSELVAYLIFQVMQLKIPDEHCPDFDTIGPKGIKIWLDKYPNFAAKLPVL